MSGKTEANKQWDLHSFSSMHHCFTGHTSHTAGTAQQHWAPSISLNYPWSVPGQLGWAGSSLGWWEVSLLWQRWHWLGFKVLQPNPCQGSLQNFAQPRAGSPLCPPLAAQLPCVCSTGLWIVTDPRHLCTALCCTQGHWSCATYPGLFVPCLYLLFAWHTWKLPSPLLHNWWQPALAGLTPVLQEMRARVKILPWSFYSKCWKSLLSSPAFPSCMGAHSNCALLINASFYNLYLIDTENGGGSPWKSIECFLSCSWQCLFWFWWQVLVLWHSSQERMPGDG